MFWMPVILLSAPAVFADEPAMPAQAARGKEIFFDVSKKSHCATCHEINKEGTAIGPDLSKIARLSPKALLIAILSSRTAFVKEIELKTRKSFPAMIVSENAKEVKVFNLADIPPEAMTLERSSVYTIRDNATWKHPPQATGYSRQQLADAIAYVRFAVFADTKGVTVEELE